MDEAEDQATGGDRPPRRLAVGWLVLVVVVLVALLLDDRPVSSGDAPPRRLEIFAWAVVGGVALLLLAALRGGREPVPRTPEREAWLCQHCLKPYAPGAHFCPRCGAPLTVYASTARYERIYATAWILGKAAHHPSRTLHIVGLALITGPVVLGPFAGLLLLWPNREAWGEGVSVLTSLASLPGLAVALLNGALLVYGLRNWRRRVRGAEVGPPEIEYGAPPWFSHDVEWALPEFEVDPSDAPHQAVGA